MSRDGSFENSPLPNKMGRWRYGRLPSYQWLSANGAIRNILNFSHALCFSQVISDVNTDRKLPLYFKPKDTLQVCYVTVRDLE